METKRNTTDLGCPIGYWRDRRGNLHQLKMYRGRPATFVGGKIRYGKAS